MEKGAVAFAVLFLISLLGIAGVYAGEAQSVDRAYACLEDYVGSEKSCSSMSLEEKVFSVLSIGECKDSLVSDRTTNYCWPSNKGSSVCNIERTAQAVLALESMGVNTTRSQEWLLAQKGISTDLIWYLQIDGEDPLKCEITYETNPDSASSIAEFVVNIGEDKKIDSNAGPCLTRANNNYWFSILPDCYDREFQIACDVQNSGDNGNFISTVLYREQGSSTYHILDYVQSSDSGINVESVTSYCFLSGGKCDYLGSLWVSLVLDYLEKDVSDFLPYLITLSGNNRISFPEPFLYILTNNLEFKTDLLGKIIFHKYWEVSNGRYYDTALALLPFQGENTLTEKQNAKKWLFSIQQANGCWDNNNVVSNGFLLYSLWPRDNHEKTLSCIDSDGGQVWNVSGHVTVDGIVNGTDYCTNGTLTEYFCKANNNSASIDVLCTDGCLNGACLTDRIGNITCAQAGFNCISPGVFCNGTIESNYICSGADVCCNPTPIDDDDVDDVDNNETSCELAGYECAFSSACTGSFVPGFDDCPGVQKCCDLAAPAVTCSSLNGIICDSGEYCSGGNPISTDDLFYGESCCLAPGLCLDKTGNEFTCEDNLGRCSSSCADGYSPNSSYTCENSADFCCMESGGGSKANGSYWWIWVLFVLVIFIVLGILYRDKIKEFIQRQRARRSGGTPPGRPGLPPRFPPSYDRSPRIGPPVQRKIIQEGRPAEKRPIVKPKSPKELDEVLKKLKEIGK